MRRMRLPFVVLLVAAAWTTGASAHTIGTHTGFVSTVSGIEPRLPGLLVNVLGGHQRLSVRNWTQKTIVIFDEQGRPAVRLEPGEGHAWPDRRIGYSGPPPEREGLVKKWRIPGEADGRPFQIAGFLGYRPPAGSAPAGNAGLPTWGIVLAGAVGAVVVAAALALPLWRRKGES